MHTIEKKRIPVLHMNNTRHVSIIQQSFSVENSLTSSVVSVKISLYHISFVHHLNKIKRISRQFFAPSGKKSQVDGKCIMYLRIVINLSCAPIKLLMQFLSYDE